MTNEAPLNEQELRRHLEDVHRQMLDRDNAYRFHEEELRGRDLQVEQLHQELLRVRGQLERQLAETQAWARELEASIRTMQATRAWRLAVNLRSLQQRAAKLTGR
jgi:hypothetical protein